MPYYILPMKIYPFCCYLIFSILASSCQPNETLVASEIVTASDSLATINNQFLGVNVGRILFDKDWKFSLGGNQGAEGKDFKDSSWRNIDLPHDWSIEDLEGTGSPFNPKAIGQASTGFTTGGTAWYRKTFSVPASSKGKKLFVQFEGVYMNSDVWINGQHLGNHPYGYTSFAYDLTEYIVYGDNNTIAVEVKNEGQNSRWYSGSGIYRHVWLQTTELLHIESDSTQIITDNVQSTAANIHFLSSVINESDQPLSARSIIRFINKAGTEVSKAETSYDIKSRSTQKIEKQTSIGSPELWSLDTPNLYKAIHEVYMNEKLVAREETMFGIRTISFSADKGFQLNGITLKLKGGCFHHDNGPLGAKAYDRAEERKVELLKQSGFNALRCSHNPPSPAFLNACDRLGMLVIDEAFDSWNYPKNSFDYHLYFKHWALLDIESIVARDRNHPSIIMWSSGNEIPEAASAEGQKTSLMLSAAIRKLDTTRLITNGVCNFANDKSGFFATLDVAGYNYAIGGENKGKTIYETDHKKNPGRIMFGAESYPIDAYENWMYVLDHPYVIGDFVWTAFDYIGEASIGWLGYPQSASFYPWNLAFCGDIDVCGFKRPQSFYRDALWKENQLSLFVHAPRPTYSSNPNQINWSTWNWLDVAPDWTWEGVDKKPLDVSVYSSCDEVELILNGKLLGRKLTNRATKFKASWQVPYVPGTLEAIGYRDGKQVNTTQLQTASRPSKIRLTADRSQIDADGQDLCYITVELCDKNGIINPKSTNEIKFSIEGEGRIEGVGNSDPTSTESYTSSHRKAWKGKCLVIVKAGEKPGNIILTARIKGLPMERITIISK